MSLPCEFLDVLCDSVPLFFYPKSAVYPLALRSRLSGDPSPSSEDTEDSSSELTTTSSPFIVWSWCAPKRISSSAAAAVRDAFNVPPAAGYDRLTELCIL